MTFWQGYVLAYAIAFGLGPLLGRMLLMWRVTGRNPWLMESTETPYGFVQRLVSIAIGGYGAMMLLYAFAPAWYQRVPGFVLAHDAWRWAGVALSALGLVVTWFAQQQMGRSWRFGPDREAPPPLVTEGIYAWVRNPIYLAMMLAGIGILLLMPDALTLALAVLGLASINTLVRLEEEFLRGVHGEAYQRYLARVGRFVPRVRSGP